MSVASNFTLSVKGGVKSGDVDPYNPATGLLRAAAICIKPVSFDTTTVVTDMRSIAWARLVFPVRLIQRSILSVSISANIASATSASLFDPNIQTCQSSVSTALHIAAKCCAGHCFASPNSAPGQMPRILVPSCRSNSSSVLLTFIASISKTGFGMTAGGSALGRKSQRSVALHHQWIIGFVEATTVR